MYIIYEIVNIYIYIYIYIYYFNLINVTIYDIKNKFIIYKFNLKSVLVQFVDEIVLHMFR